MKKLIRFFIDQPLLVNLLTIGIIVLGFWSLSSLHKEGYPEVDQRIMYITTIYPGASPEEVEANLTIPMEESIQGISGIDHYISISRENISYLEITIEDSYANPDEVKEEIRRGIDKVDLPDEVTDNPDIQEWKTSLIPVMEIGLSSETAEYEVLRTRAKDLENLLQGLDVVSSIDEKAILDKEVKIELDLGLLNANRISIQEVINTIDQNNIELTGGVYKDEEVDKLITVSSRLRDIEDVKDIILRSTFEGYNIRVEDIAEVKDGFEDKTTLVRYNGKSGVSLIIKKKKSADIIDTVDTIKEYLDEYQLTIENDDITLSILWDLSKQARKRLEIVENNALIGLGLVLIILFIFLNSRNAIWTALGIPFSVAFAVIFLKQFGISINNISLLGIIVVLGMVVDDAIVVSENIYRHKMFGKSWKDAAVDATSEVSAPVFTSILTTIMAFLALYVGEGMLGEFAKAVPLAVIFILIGSLIESLFILPAHIAHPLIKNDGKKPLKEKRFILGMKRVYKNLLNTFIKLRWVFIPIFVGLLAWSLFAMFSGEVLKFISFPTEESSTITINGEIRDGQNLDYSSEKMGLIENFLAEYPETVMESYSVEIGEIGYPEKFVVEVHLTPYAERDLNAYDIRDEIREMMIADGSFTNFYFIMESGGPPVGRPLELNIVGSDDDERKKISDDVVNYLASIPGIFDIIRSDEEKKKEMVVEIDYEKAASLMVSPDTIGETIRASFYGVIATKIQTPEEMVEYRVLLDDEYQNNLSTLDELYILNDNNTLIKLSPLVDIEEQRIVSKYDHYNGERTTIIQTEIDKSIITPKEVYNTLVEDFENFESEHPGFYMIISGEAKSSKNEIDMILEAFYIALIGVFMILIFQFKSIPQTLIVMLAIPFSIIGIAISLIIHHLPLSYMALFGGVGLIGVVVNDSVVMIDHLNSMKRKMSMKNMTRYIIEGASTRLRPVIVTTVTTMAGLMPTAYGIGGMDSMIQPTTIVMSWGLLFATLLTLFLIPTLYLIQFRSNKRRELKKKYHERFKR